jgi:hypothetical protein
MGKLENNSAGSLLALRQTPANSPVCDLSCPPRYRLVFGYSRVVLSHVSGGLYCLRRVGGGDASPGLTVMLDEAEAARLAKLAIGEPVGRAAEA